MSKTLTSMPFRTVTSRLLLAASLVPASLLASLALPAAHAAGEHAGGHHDSPVGQPGVAAQASRTIHVDMTDAMRFHPARLDVKEGETVRLRVKNSGVIKHELVIGTEADLKAHDEQMKKFPGMEHEDPAMVSVAPGQIGEILWKFTKSGTVDFACLQPGHFDAGMAGQVAVASNNKAKAEESTSPSPSSAPSPSPTAPRHHH